MFGLIWSSKISILIKKLIMETFTRWVDNSQWPRIHIVKLLQTRTLHNPAFSEKWRVYVLHHTWSCSTWNFFFSFSSNNITVNAQRQAWINGFKVKIELKHQAGLINPLAHPGRGEYWQPTNHHHVCVFYMIKHIAESIKSPLPCLINWQLQDPPSLHPVCFLFPFKNIKIHWAEQ